MPDEKDPGVEHRKILLEKIERVFREKFKEQIGEPWGSGFYHHELPKVEEACRNAVKKLADEYRVPAAVDVRVTADVETGDMWVDFKASPELVGVMADLGLIRRSKG